MMLRQTSAAYVLAALVCLTRTARAFEYNIQITHTSSAGTSAASASNEGGTEANVGNFVAHGRSSVHFRGPQPVVVQQQVPHSAPGVPQQPDAVPASLATASSTYSNAANDGTDRPPVVTAAYKSTPGDTAPAVSFPIVALPAADGRLLRYNVEPTSASTVDNEPHTEVRYVSQEQAAKYQQQHHDQQVQREQQAQHHIKHLQPQPQQPQIHHHTSHVGKFSVALRGEEKRQAVASFENDATRAQQYPPHVFQHQFHTTDLPNGAEFRERPVEPTVALTRETPAAHPPTTLARTHVYQSAVAVGQGTVAVPQPPTGLNTVQYILGSPEPQSQEQHQLPSQHPANGVAGESQLNQRRQPNQHPQLEAQSQQPQQALKQITNSGYTQYVPQYLAPESRLAAHGPTYTPARQYEHTPDVHRFYEATSRSHEPHLRQQAQRHFQPASVGGLGGVNTAAAVSFSGFRYAPQLPFHAIAGQSAAASHARPIATARSFAPAYPELARVATYGASAYGHAYAGPFGSYQHAAYQPAAQTSNAASHHQQQNGAARDHQPPANIAYANVPSEYLQQQQPAQGHHVFYPEAPSKSVEEAASLVAQPVPHVSSRVHLPLVHSHPQQQPFLERTHDYYSASSKKAASSAAAASAASKKSAAASAKASAAAKASKKSS